MIKLRLRQTKNFYFPKIYVQRLNEVKNKFIDRFTLLKKKQNWGKKPLEKLERRKYTAVYTENNKGWALKSTTTRQGSMSHILIWVQSIVPLSSTSLCLTNTLSKRGMGVNLYIYRPLSFYFFKKTPPLSYLNAFHTYHFKKIFFFFTKSIKKLCGEV